MTVRGDLVPPEGVPPVLYTRHVACALGLTDEQVKHRMNYGHIKTRRIGRRGHRFVTPVDLMRFARDAGLRIDWDAVMFD